MKGTYVKPEMFVWNESVGIIPAVIALGMSLASALGLAASSAAAVGGLAAGAGAAAAVGGAAAAGTALAKKGRNRFESWERLPALDVVEAYT